MPQNTTTETTPEFLTQNITSTTTQITSTSQIPPEKKESTSQIPQTTHIHTPTVESTTQFTHILTTETTPPLTSTTEQSSVSTRAKDVPTTLTTLHTAPQTTIPSATTESTTTSEKQITDQTTTQYTTKASTEKTQEITTRATTTALFTTPLTDSTTQITSTSQIQIETEASTSQLSQTTQIPTSTVESTTKLTTTTEQSTLFTQAKDGETSIPITPAASKILTLSQTTIPSSPTVHMSTTEKPLTDPTSTQYISEVSTEKTLEIATPASTPELFTEPITDTTIQITSKSQIPTETDKSTSQLPQTTHIDTSTPESTTLYGDILTQPSTQGGVTPEERTSASTSASSLPEHIFTLNTTRLSSTTNLASLLHSTLSEGISIFNGSSFVHPTFLSTKTKFPDSVSTTTSSPFVSSLQTSSISTLRSLISKFHNFSTLSPPNATNMSESSTSSLLSTSHFVTNNETYISEETNSTLPTHSKSIAQNFSYSPTSLERTKPTILTVITRKVKQPDFSPMSTTNTSNQSSTLTVLKTFHPSTSMKITNESELYITKQPTHGILVTNTTRTKDKSYTMITARTSAKANKRLPVTKILNATDFDEKIYSTPSSPLQTKPNASSTMLVISRSIQQHLSTPIKTHSTGKTVLPSPSSSSSTNTSMIIISRRTKPVTSIIPPTITTTMLNISTILATTISPMKGSIIFGFDLLSLGTRRASFIHKFINAFMPYSGYSHYSIVSWSKRPLHVNFPLSKHDSDRREPHIPDLADIVEKIKNDLSSTSVQEHNLGNGDIPPVVVLFVDPLETSLTMPLIKAVRQLKKSRARVFLLNIGISKWPKQGTLELLSSEPSQLHIVHAPSYRQLLNRALNTPYQFRLLSNQYKPITFKKTNAPAY
ncbi:Hypothetical predicted protein [Octopus vulgaris]|uniref:Mucin-5AC-like n=1 Tax=Octopus vulgaris TaxID=6645 RepID=A0AA36FDI2_OCTVU|nr:Hypothetical predicted protein [Octopus vulgaris]